MQLLPTDPTGRANESEVTVVIPSWNGKDLLKSICLPALKAQSFRDFTIVVVDNGSTDGSGNYLRSSWPEVEVIELPANVGFAAAVNRGISEARTDLIALVNNDVELERTWMREMVSASRRFPTAGSLACKVLDYDDRTLICTVGDCVSGAGGFFARGHRERDTGQHDAVRPVFTACAGAALYRREAFDQVGLFDEDFFAYGEDVDWGFRAQLLGFESYSIPSAVAYHVGGATSSTVSGLRESLLARNTYWFILKNFPTQIIVRNLHKIAFVVARRFYRVARSHGGRLALRSISAALLQTPRMLRKRQATYGRRRASNAYLCGMLEREPSLGSDRLAGAALRWARLKEFAPFSGR